MHTTDDASQGAPAAPVRVLVIDDNRFAADALVEGLRHLGFDSSAAYDGSGALAEAERCRPQVALVDIGLPDMDGYGLATRLRELNGAMRVIGLSGYPEGRNDGDVFDQRLVKPVPLATLREAILG